MSVERWVLIDSNDKVVICEIVFRDDKWKCLLIDVIVLLVIIVFLEKRLVGFLVKKILKNYFIDIWEFFLDMGCFIEKFWFFNMFVKCWYVG